MHAPWPYVESDTSGQWGLRCCGQSTGSTLSGFHLFLNQSCLRLSTGHVAIFSPFPERPPGLYRNEHKHTMPLPVSVGNRLAFARDAPDKIAASIVMPQDTAPVRLPVQTGTERTALLPFQSTGTITFDANFNGVCHALLFRHAICPLWISGTFSAVNTNYGHNTLLDISDDSFFQERLELTGYTVWDSTVVPGYPSWFAPPSPSSPNIPVATDELLGVDYFWCPGGYAWLRVTVPGNTTVLGSVYANLYRWEFPGEEQSNSAQGYTVGFGAPAFAPVVPGWYRWGNLRSEGITNANGSSALAFNCGWTTDHVNFPASTGVVNGIWPFNPPPDFANVSSYPWVATRTNSAAALLSNISQVFEKQGTVLGARITASDQPFNPAPSLLSTRTPMEKYFGAFETGVYTWSSPSPESQVYRPQYRQGFNSTNNGFTYNPWILLSDAVYYNAVMFTDTSSNPYPMIAATVDWHIEFRSTSPLFPPAISTTALEVVHQAYLAVAAINPFSENPEHKQLKKMAVAAANKLAHHYMGPAAAPMMHVAKTAANRMMQRVPGSQTPSNGTGGRGRGNRPPVNAPPRMVVIHAPLRGGKGGRKGRGKGAPRSAQHFRPKPHNRMTVKQRARGHTGPSWTPSKKGPTALRGGLDMYLNSRAGNRPW